MALCVAIDDLLQFRGRNNTGLSPHDLALLEEDERGYAADTVSSGGLGIFVDIDFNDLGRATDFGLEVFEDGLHRFAGSAPFGVEVDEGGRFGIDDVGKCGHETYFLQRK